MLHKLDPGAQCPEVVRMIVEIPRNCSNKYEFDTELGLFRLDRVLYSPLQYPGDYGLIPGTLAQDGDPLDVLVPADQATFTGCLLEVRPVGLLEMADEKGPDQKIVAVPERNPRYQEVCSIDQLAPHICREIEHFFDIYKELEGKETQVFGWQGPKEARQAVLQARAAYLECQV